MVVNAAATIAGGSTIQTVYSAAPTNPSLVSATIDDPGCGVGTVISYAGTTENRYRLSTILRTIQLIFFLQAVQRHLESAYHQCSLKLP